MKKILSILLGVLTALPTFARDFTYEYKGQTLTYTVLDEDAKTCQTKSGENSAGNTVSGALIIPEIAKDGNNEYKVILIGDYAFNGCTGLTSVEIPNSVTSINKYAFNGCTGLTSVKIPNSVTYISWFAFNGCTGLTSVKIPNSVTYIGEYAFEGCSGLTSIEIPNSVTEIGFYAFYGCTGLTSVKVSWEKPFWINPNVFSESIYSEAILDIPVNTMFDYLECTPWRMFQNLSVDGKLTKLFLDADFKYRLIENSNNADAILIGVNNIELKEANIPESITDDSDSSNPIRYYVTAIGSWAFFGCSGMTSVEIPNLVTSIGTYAFSGCSGLTSVEIPNSVTSIAPWAFADCSGLTTVTIPNSVTSIGGAAFSGCSGLTSVEIPNSVTSIGEGAFRDCSSLTSVEIPNSVTSIGGSTFWGCSGLTSVIIPNSVTSIGLGAFRDCSGLTSVTIPNSVTSIGGAAFSGCSGLTSVEIPNSVTSIGNSAFYNCSGLTSVTIPGSVTAIGNSAFSSRRISNLTSVYYNSEDPVEFESSNIFTSYSEATLYVPDVAVEKCKLINPWKNFNSIQAYKFNGIEAITQDIDSNLPCEVYNLAGVKIADSTEDLNAGLYIVRQGPAVKKIVVK